MQKDVQPEAVKKVDKEEFNNKKDNIKSATRFQLTYTPEMDAAILSFAEQNVDTDGKIAWSKIGKDNPDVFQGKNSEQLR